MAIRQTGLFTNGDPEQAALVNTGSFFLNNPGGTLVGYEVQSNYNPNINRCGTPTVPAPCGLTAADGATGVFFNHNKTLINGSPIANFGPRVGLAWQPFGDKFVVRAGYGIFYDAVYANLLANNNAGNAPYSGAVPASPANSLDLPAATQASRSDGSRARWWSLPAPQQPVLRSSRMPKAAKA